MNKAEAIMEIENKTGLELSPNTFNYWWKKYKNGEPLFQALMEQHKALVAALRGQIPPSSN